MHKVLQEVKSSEGVVVLMEIYAIFIYLPFLIYKDISKKRFSALSLQLDIPSHILSIGGIVGVGPANQKITIYENYTKVCMTNLPHII